MTYILYPGYPKSSPPVVVGLARHVQREEDRRHEGHTAAVDSTQDLLGDQAMGISGTPK